MHNDTSGCESLLPLGTRPAAIGPYPRSVDERPVPGMPHIASTGFGDDHDARRRRPRRTHHHGCDECRRGDRRGQTGASSVTRGRRACIRRLRGSCAPRAYHAQPLPQHCVRPTRKHRPTDGRSFCARPAAALVGPRQLDRILNRKAIADADGRRRSSTNAPSGVPSRQDFGAVASDFTAIFFDCTSGFFGTVIASTPRSSEACSLSSSAPSGSVKLRLNEP